MSRKGPVPEIQGVEVALAPEELELDPMAMTQKYEEHVREQQAQVEKEDFSDMVAEHAAKQKVRAVGRGLGWDMGLNPLWGASSYLAPQGRGIDWLRVSEWDTEPVPSRGCHSSCPAPGCGDRLGQGGGYDPLLAELFLSLSFFPPRPPCSRRSGKHSPRTRVGVARSTKSSSSSPIPSVFNPLVPVL